MQLRIPKLHRISSDVVDGAIVGTRLDPAKDRCAVVLDLGCTKELAAVSAD